MFNNAHTNRYKTRRDGNMTVATATFAGKPVYGYAKCHPEDKFADKFGADLAIVRCAEKINAKRVRNANKKLKDAERALAEAHKHYDKMKNYVEDANAETIEIQSAKEAILATLD